MVLSAIHILLLGRMAWEDFKERAIYLFWFPVLFLVWYFSIGLVDTADICLNLFWVILQLFILTSYFSLKHKALINITKAYLGWGDILLWIVAGFFLPTLLFIGLAFLSFVVALVFGRILRQSTIPLAGYYALVLMAAPLLLKLHPSFILWTLNVLYN